MRPAQDRSGRIRGKKLKNLWQFLFFPLRLCKVAAETEKAPGRVCSDGLEIAAKARMA